MIRIHCPKCDAALSADDSRAGTTARCPKCGQTLHLPDGKRGSAAERPGPKADAASRKKPPAHDEEDFESDFEVVAEEAPRPRAKPSARVEDDQDERSRRPKARPRDEDEGDEDDEPKRRPKRKKKHQHAPGRTTLLTLVGVDVGASLLVGILILAGLGLGFVLISPPLTPLFRMTPARMALQILNPTVLVTLVLVRGLVGAGLGWLAYVGQDLARFAHAVLLLVGAGLAGVGFLLSIINMIRFASVIGFSGEALLYLFLAFLWQAGHAVLGFQFLWNADVQNFVMKQAERS